MIRDTAVETRIVIPSLEELPRFVGREIALTEWSAISQQDVDAFAAVTRDPDWMHIDAERARNGPLGHTIVQGFFTLSLLTYFNQKAAYLPADIAYAFNYGLDRVRWMQPLKVGARVRNRTVLLEVQDRGSRRFIIRTRNTVEIEDSSTPAMVADWLCLLQGQDPARAKDEQSSWRSEEASSK
jgi:acyl dehydratase